MDSLQQTHIIFGFWSAIFSIIAALVVLITIKFDRKGAKSILGLLISNASINLFESLAYYYRGNVTDFGYFMVRISNFAVFLFNIILSFFVFKFINYMIDKNGGKSHKGERITIYTLISISIILLFLSRIFKFYYSFDADNKYFRQNSYWIMPALSGLVLIIIIEMTIRNWKYLKMAERIEFLMLEILPIIALILQIFIYGVSITTIVNTITILFIFVIYEIGYSKYVIQKEKILFNQMIEAFAEAIDEKDPYTGGHSIRVAKYSSLIAQKMNFDEDHIEKVHQMAMLHDIGKIGIADSILKKDGKLTVEEYNIIKNHPNLGFNILNKITEDASLLIGAKWHHERYDGKGYPEGLKGEEIPIEARIIGMADCYDAMTSNRRYRKPFTQDEVKEEIKKNLGTQFDPFVGKIMLEIINDDTNFKLHE